MNHAVGLADIHDIGHADDFSWSKTILGITRETLVELHEDLWVSESPRIDLANVGITARCSANVVLGVNKTRHALIQASSEGGV